MDELLLVGGILVSVPVFIGIIFVAIGLIRSSASKDWPRTDGVIIKKEQHYSLSLGKILNNESIKSNRPDQRPTFQFTVEGKDYIKTSAMQQTPGFQPGNTVTVLYNPDDPNQAVINTKAQRGTIFTIIGAAIISVTIFLAIIGGIYLIITH